MRIQVQMFVGLCLAGALAGGCSERGFRDFTAGEQELVAASNDFGFRLLDAVMRQPQLEGENVILSPLSASYALGMATNGAAGETRSEMVAALGFEGGDILEVDEWYHGLMGVLRATDGSVSWNLANSVWLQEGFPVSPGFKQTCERFFSARSSNVDFAGDFKGAKETINGWVEEQTRGRIKEAFGPPPADTVLLAVLVNAVYFKGNWTQAFDPEDTKPGVFLAQDGAQIPVAMMKLEAELPYLAAEGFKAVSLAYGNGNFRMTLVLPREGFSIDDLATRLAGGEWSNWLAGLEKQEGRVELPRFTLEKRYRMNTALQGMGMQRAFSPDLADFSVLTGQPSDLFIGFVDQGTFLLVDEEGTEAAAVTSVGGVGLTMEGGGGFVMKLDRPFLVVIHDVHSGTVLFAGAIRSLPSES